MGATSDMFSGPWRMLPQTRFLDWPAQNAPETIPSLAEHLIATNGIGSGDSLIGTSLGGIVACEIANQVSLNKLVLIGSAIRKEEINPLLNLPPSLIDLAPLDMFIKVAGKMDSHLADMFSKSDPAFIRNMSKSIFSWQGLKAEKKAFRVHGRHDHVIPIPAEVDLRIDGGHLIAMTHATDCVTHIQQWLDVR